MHILPSKKENPWSFIVGVTLIVLVVTLLPLFIAWLIIGQWLDERALDNRGVTAVAQIDDSLEPRIRRSATEGHRGTFRVQYVDKQGITRSAWVHVARDYHDKITVGQTVSIEYDPQDPENARVANPDHNVPRWTTSVRKLLRYLAYILVIVLAIGIYRLVKKRRAAKHR
jgi:hypothetical protein